MRTLTDDARLESSFALMHLYEFDINELDGTFKETMHFTDHDIFVVNEGIEYTPLSISFQELTEDVTMQSNSVTLQLDNINEEISRTALAYEWRNNRARITRIIYIPPADTIGGVTYEFGYGDNLIDYPKINISNIQKDTYVLFEGVIDRFTASQQSVTATISTKFANWKKPYPKRTYNQNEFNSVIDAISNTVYWGRVKA